MAREKQCRKCGAEYATRLPVARKRLDFPLWRQKRKRGVADPSRLHARALMADAHFVWDNKGVVHKAPKFIEDWWKEYLQRKVKTSTTVQMKLAAKTEQCEAAQFDRQTRRFFALLRENKHGFSWAEE